MIIQGSNTPITLTMDGDLSTIPTIVATLWNDAQMLKRWNLADMTVDGSTITLPLTEAETSAMKPGKVIAEVKGLDSTDSTIFWDEAVISVVGRYDKGIKLTE